MGTPRNESSDKKAVLNSWSTHRFRYPFYAFRIWHGMIASSWFRILARNRFAISPARLPLALVGSLLSLINSFERVIQELIFAKDIAESVLDKPPIFIIGHWRTGTTYVHELMTIDDRFTAPTTLECFAPAHFLVSGGLLRTLSFLLPTNRPMDNMLISWDSPQEDEFALLNLGFGSPYETLMFPNHRPVRNEFLNMTEIAPKEVEAWKAGLLWFLQRVNFRSNREKNLPGGSRRIVLKSPEHTARLHILRQMFPMAQYIHIVRHPYDVFASTVWTWRTLYETQGLQKSWFGFLPNGGPSIEQYVLDNMDLLYRDFFMEVAKIPQDQFCEVRYEDIIRAPVAEMDRIYRHLSLGSLDSLQSKLTSDLRKREGYKPNEYSISEKHKAEVYRRWRWYFERYGYHSDLTG